MRYNQVKLKRFYIFLFLFWFVTNIIAGDSIRYAGRPRVGLVLSGGGAKGIAHVGALKVIEEVGIPIDYIGGTSMGSIVGGLYALGYTSAQLETYMKEADWENLLTNRILRRHVSIYEKGERKRYWLQIPLTGHKIELPLGILSGQNVSNLFTELASPAYAQPDFSKLPIPFLCVATDIGSGSEVVIEHGNLAKAMRASMAIPSVFTPELIDGKQLYDGGLTNNFPANRLIDKGIDILIGVDVGSQAQLESTELNNIYQIMEKVVFMSSLPLKDANRKLCCVLISPNIPEYSASSFNAVDSLIVRGERAARLHYDELKALADSLRTFESDQPEQQVIRPQPLRSFYVKEVKISGLQYVSTDFFLQRLELNIPCEMTFLRLNNALEKIKGTQFFHSIIYQLNPLPDGTVELQFDCVERRANMLGAGLHYDNEFKAALLLNLSLRNVLLNDSKASAELSIGANPSFLLTFFHSPGFQSTGKKFFKASLLPNWLFNMNGYRFDAYNYSGNRRTTAYTFSNFSTGVQALASPSLNSVIGGGISGEYTMIRTRIGNESDDLKSNYIFLTYRLFYERDTYNEDYFPTMGYKFRMEGNYNKGLSNNVLYSEGLFGVMFRSNFAITPVYRWTVHTGIDAGSIFGSDIPPQYMIYLGGAPDKHLRNDITFVGMNFLQENSRNVWVAHFNNQIRLWNNIYVTLRANLGKTDGDLPELLTLKDFRIGCGISAQYNSVVGPLGFTISSSNVTRSLLGAFHLGFWF